MGGESEGDHQGVFPEVQEFVPDDPAASAAAAAAVVAAASLRLPNVVSGDNHADGTPLFATIQNLVGDGEAAATGEAVAANLDAAGDQSGAGRVVDGNDSHRASQPLVVDDDYDQNRAKRAGGSFVAEGSPPRRLGHGGLGGRIPLVTSGEGDVSVGGDNSGDSSRGSGGRGGEMDSEEDSGDGGNGEEESLSRRLPFSPDEDGGGGGVCRPLKIEGLDNCPELMLDGGERSNAVVRNLLATKADMLRQV